jgi:hypothetical protein
MEKVIKITIDDIELDTSFNDTKTAETIWKALPLSATINTWGNEIYFPIPISIDPERGQDVVDIGDLGYWPTGNAFCIFYGRTPMSQGEEIRPASTVTVFGKIAGDATILKKVSGHNKITIQRK